MPTYTDSPFYQRKALVAGVPAYSFGSFDQHNPGARMAVTSVAITSNVATLNVKLLEGTIPIVNQLVSVEGTQTATSGGAPNFNVTDATITAVTGFSTGDNSTGTISFALTSSNIATTTDAGLAIAPTPELADAMANGSGTQFAVTTMQGFPSNSRDVQWSIETPSAPSAFTANLQGAMIDEDSQYETIDSMTAVGNQTYIGTRANFLRINLSGVSGGTNPTVIGKIEI